MIERPYRSGAIQKCLLCRLSEKDKKEVVRIGKYATIGETIAWLEEQGIKATTAQVQYFLRKRGILPKNAVIPPKNTYIEKMDTYIDELLKLESKTFTLWILNLRGASWTVITRTLHKDGMISSMGGNPRTRWKIIASKDEFRAWRDNEVKKQKQREVRG